MSIKLEKNGILSKLKFYYEKIFINLFCLYRGSKKSIVNKFPLQAAVTGLIWFHEGFLIAGLSDGQVRSCNTRTNKSKTLYTMNTGVIAIAYK